MEYTETIEPTTIARRLMEIREQMAEQLSADLQQMAAENAKLQRDYADEVGRSIPQKNSLGRGRHFLFHHHDPRCETPCGKEKSVSYRYDDLVVSFVRLRSCLCSDACR